MVGIAFEYNGPESGDAYFEPQNEHTESEASLEELTRKADHAIAMEARSLFEALTPEDVIKQGIQARP